MSDTASPRRELGRVFVGVWEIANLIYTSAEALRERGYDVSTLFIETPFNPYYQANSYDDRIAWPAGDRIYRAWRDRGGFDLKMAWKLIKAIPRVKTFVFVWRYSFLPFQLDIPLLRLLGKNVVVFFCGDDVRYKPIQLELDRRRGAYPWWPEASPSAFERWLAWGRTFWEAFWTVKLVEKSGCIVVGSRDSATFQGRPYAGLMLPQRMLVDGPREPAKRPLVVHAPTDRALKGTDIVEPAIERLRAEGLEFDFELIEGLPTGELEALLARSDIVIDQPGGWPGRLGIAGLAAGAVVLGGNRPDYWHLPDESPVVQFERDVERLAAELRELIRDTGRRRETMAASYGYAKRTYSYEAWADWFEQLFQTIPHPVEPLQDQRAQVAQLAETLPRKLAVRLFW